MGREFPEAPVVGVAGVVIRGNQVLLVKRGREPLKGEWSLPGGRQELGETAREGVEREILEETALVVRAITVVDVIDSIFREAGGVKYHYVLIDFLCTVISGGVQAATDAQEAQWVGRERLNSHGAYKLDPITVLVIEKAFEIARTTGQIYKP